MIEINSNGFGECDYSVIKALIHCVCELLECGWDYSALPDVNVIHWDEDYPMCSNSDEGCRIICLTTGENYWCQWVYQFAHEYCHHLIDGEMSGEMKGCDV